MKLRLDIATYENGRFVVRTQVAEVDLPDGVYVRSFEIWDATKRPPNRGTGEPNGLLASVVFAPTDGRWVYYPPEAGED